VLINRVLYLDPYEMRVMYGVFLSNTKTCIFERKKMIWLAKKGGGMEGLNIEIVNFFNV
jgi:hypothetical protein